MVTPLTLLLEELLVPVEPVEAVEPEVVVVVGVELELVVVVGVELEVVVGVEAVVVPVA